jgi:hypothetical protein
LAIRVRRDADRANPGDAQPVASDSKAALNITDDLARVSIGIEMPKT